MPHNLENFPLQPKLEKKDTLPVEKVKNKVIWSNHDLPFQIKEGEELPIGYFLKGPKKEKKSEERSKNKFYLRFVPEFFKKAKISTEGAQETREVEVVPKHHRSAVVGRVVFQDDEGNFYRDIDIKGMGHLGYEESVNPIDKYKKAEVKGISRFDMDSKESLGILDMSQAIYDAEMGEAFYRAGIRTDRVLAVSSLEEIITDGKHITVEEARQKNLISENSKPALSIRAFGVKTRVGEKRSFEKPVIDDVLSFISFEENLSYKLTPDGYLKWFAINLGKNVGLIHKNGWFHGYLYTSGAPANVTLDCRITDRDSVGYLKNLSSNEVVEKKNYDRMRAEQIIEVLYLALALDFGDDSGTFGKISKKDLLNLFRKEYLSVT